MGIKFGVRQIQRLAKLGDDVAGEGIMRVLLAVDMCRAPLPPPFSEHCNFSDKSLKKPVRSTGTTSRAHNLGWTYTFIDTRRHC